VLANLFDPFLEYGFHLGKIYGGIRGGKVQMGYVRGELGSPSIYKLGHESELALFGGRITGNLYLYALDVDEVRLSEVRGREQTADSHCVRMPREGEF
jgi:hypothetical protein